MDATDVFDWYGKLLRDFVDASFRTFQQTEEMCMSFRFESIDGIEENDKFRFILLEQSRIHRAHLRVLKQEVMEMSENYHSDEEIFQALEGQHDLVFQFHQSWHLIEVFILNPTRFVAVEFAGWLQATCPPLEYDNMFGDATHPELSDTYWSTIYGLAMRGRFDVVLEALMRHSEIALSVQGHQRFAGSLDRNQCQMLLSLFTSHPYVELLPKLEEVGFHSSSIDNNALDEWKQRVSILAESQLTLKIPELDTLFQIMLGDHRTLQTLANNDWVLLSLSQLLFVYPSILARSNLSRIVEECIQSTTSKGENMLFDGLRNIMMGSVGETIKSLLNIANSLSKRNIKNPEVRTMCLVTIGHLCRLLTQSGNSLELLETWENGCFGASFCEEVFLGAVVSANDQLFPVQLIYYYLSKCPLKGKEMLRTLLTKRPFNSDEEAEEIADALRSAQFYNDARQVLIKRGMLLLSENIYPHFRRSIDENAALYPSRDKFSSAQSVGDAARFFQKAGHYDMILDLVDATLYRCMHAVRMHNVLFDNLKVFPGPLVDSWNQKPLYPKDSSGAAVPFLTADELEIQGSQNVYSDDRNTLFEDLWPRNEVPRFMKKPSQGWTDEQKRVHLRYALDEAKYLFEALLAIDESYWLKYPAILDSLLALKQYHNAVQTVLAFNRANVNPDARNAKIREAAKLITDIILPPKGLQPKLNIRYWLHLIDLAVWFHRHISEIERVQSLNPSFLEHMDNYLKQDLKLKWCKGVYSKDQCESLLELLTFIGESEAADFIYAITSTTTVRLNVLLHELHSMSSTMAMIDNKEHKERNRFPERVAALKTKAMQINIPTYGQGFGEYKAAGFSSPVFHRGGKL